MDAAVRVQAYRIAEHKDVRLPIVICQDGFITSHAVENIELLEDDIVKTFVGEYEPEHYLLKDNEPFAVGPYAVTNYVMEAKRAQMQGLRNAKQITLDVAKEFEKISGRSYGLFEEYRMEDADYAMVIIGSAAGTGKDTVDMLRKQGVRAGCGATIAVRNVLRGLHEEDEAVITCATGCLEVSSFMYPYTAWKDSFIHNAFENAGATCSGVEAAYRALKKKHSIPFAL